MGLSIGVDIGGTKIAAGLVDDDGVIVEQRRSPTPAHDPDRVAETIAGLVNELARGRRIEAVGLGAAGFVDETRSTVRFAPNLAWREEPLRKRVGSLVGMPVVVENDANAMAWAEARFGAGRGEDHILCLTLGTGIGGGVILDGRLYRGRWGMGGEFGHYRVVPGGRRCGCGNLGCWERYASGTALVLDAREIAAADPARARVLLEIAGGAPASIRGQQVTAAARAGDEVALEAFARLAGWLGQGMADLAAVLDPGCFIVGGGLSQAADLFLDDARRAFARALTGAGHRPTAEIRLAELGASAGLVGAADLARLR